MMAAQRLRWRSQAQRARLAEALRAPLDQWQTEWATRSATVRLDPCDTCEVGDTPTWRAADSGTGSAWLGFGADAPTDLGVVLLGVSSPDSLGLAGALGRRAATALLAAFAKTASAKVADSDAPGEAELAPRHGGACFQIEAEGLSMKLGLDGELVDRWLGTKPGAGVSLHARDAALDSAPVDISVSLALGDSSLEAARGLRVGDVLVSSTPLDAAFQLTVGESAALAFGRLCRHHRHRALKLEGAPTKPIP